MILRSTSSPALKTLVYQISTQEADLGQKISQTRPVSFCIERTSSEVDMRRLSLSTYNKKSPKRLATNVCMETVSSLLGDHRSVAVAGLTEEKMISIGGGKGIYSGGGGGGGEGSGGVGDSDEEHNYGSESMDAYYQHMIKAYPGEALFLVNYAKFLKEVRGDTVKAEELCERAILAKARDGELLSMYGDLIWNNHEDADRAKSYFDQAVKSSPHDCYVLASYASFLWDAGEEEVEKEDEEEKGLSSCGYPPLVAAS